MLIGRQFVPLHILYLLVGNVPSGLILAPIIARRNVIIDTAHV